MKISARVSEVAQRGDELVVRCFARVRRAKWAGESCIELAVPSTEANCRAYYVGRRVRIMMEPA